MVCCILAAYLFGRMCVAARWAYRKLLRRPQPVEPSTMPTPTRALSPLSASAEAMARLSPFGG
jgi:hypothetical protein